MDARGQINQAAKVLMGRRRNTKRSMTRYLKLAKALISGESGFEETLGSL